MPMSTASLFAIIKKQKQSRGTFAEGMVKMCCMCMMEYWSAGKKNGMCREMAVPGKYNVMQGDTKSEMKERDQERVIVDNEEAWGVSPSPAL